MLSAKTQGRLLAAFGQPAERPVPESLLRLAARLGVSDPSLAQPSLQARLPFDLTVK